MGDVVAQVLADPAAGYMIVAAVAVLAGWIRGGFAVQERKLARIERKIDALIRHERLFDKLDDEGYPKPKEEVDRELLEAWNWSQPKRDE